MSRSLYKRIKAKVRTFFELDAEELVELQEAFNETIEEVELPRTAEARANSRQVEEADLDLIRPFPLFEHVEDLFNSHGDNQHFPSWEKINKIATINAEREMKGLKVKPLPWEEDPWAPEADEVYRALKRAEKTRLRTGSSPSSLVNKARLLYERRAGEAEALLAAKCVAAYDFAVEWIEERLDTLDELRRANKRLAMLADEEELANINRGLRKGNPKAKMAMELREIRERLLDLEVQDALSEFLKGLNDKQRFTRPEA